MSGKGESKAGGKAKPTTKAEKKPLPARGGKGGRGGKKGGGSWLRWPFRLIGLVLVMAAGAVLWLDQQNPFFNDLGWLAIAPALYALLSMKVDWASVALGVLAAAGWGYAAPSPKGPVPVKLMVMGVDGATFEIVDTHRDQLPNFQALKKDGTRGVLTSMEPMFSPLLWTTMASGRPPDEHGIRGFNVHSNDCQVARFWDVAEDKGMSVGLYKWLVDYPPRSFKTGGFWVPSWLAPDVHTWPAELSIVKEVELSKRLRRKQVASKDSAPMQALRLAQQGVRLSTMVKAARWSWRERFDHPDTVTVNVEMQKLRGWIDHDVFIAWLHREKPQLATFNYYATDGLAHLYWDRYEKGGTEVLEAYEQADAILGDIRAQLSPDTRFILVSDHGFKAMDGKGLAGQFAPLTERLKARLGTQGFTGVDVSKVGHKLTVAFGDAGQRDAVHTFLVGLADGAGNPFYKVEEVAGSNQTFGLTLADEAITAERLKSDTVSGEPIADYVKLTDAYTGTHKENGVVFLAGPGVEAGKELPPQAMLDVAPTILAAMGLPASKEMTGKPIVFPEAGARVDDYDTLILSLPWLTGSEGVNEEQLKQLGYIDDGKK